MNQPFVAGLPMYDWPEVAADVDELWAHIVRAGVAHSIELPEQLTRTDDLVSLWSDPQMILGQVCSLNPVRDGLGETEVLGTIIYDAPPELPPMDAGTYSSVIVCRADDERRPSSPLGLGRGLASDAIDSFGGARVAANGTDSQSGYWSLGHFLRERDQPIFGPATFTGAHRESVRSVANGETDIAAVDIHSWRLATEHEPVAASKLVVVGLTDPTPGVVCVVSWELADRRRVVDAILGEAIAAFVERPAADRLHISGYRTRRLEEFQIVADQVEAAAARTWHA